MRAFIESLESREMFSAAVHAAPHAIIPHTAAIHKSLVHKALIQKPASHNPAVHAPVQVTANLMFAGTAADSNGENAELLATIMQTDTGYSASVRIIDADGTINTFTMTSDATGAFNYVAPIDRNTTVVNAQLSADHNSITGNFTSTLTDGTSNAGTLSLSRTLLPAKFYVGRGQDGTGQGATFMVVVTPTVTGYVAQVRCINPDGSIGGVILTGDTTGHFIYDGPDNDGAPLHVDAQLSADGQIVTGAFTNINSNGSTHTGTFTLSRT